MTTKRPSARFVPTLTEVVRPGVASGDPTPDHERLIEQVIQAVKPRLELQLRASLQALIEQQLRISSPRLQQDIEEAVRVAVARAIPASKSPKN